MGFMAFELGEVEVTFWKGSEDNFGLTIDPREESWIKFFIFHKLLLPLIPKGALFESFYVMGDVYHNCG